MARHRWFLADDATELLTSLAIRHPREILKCIEQIAEYPEQAADREENLERRDFVKTKRFGKWRITWWVDGPVKEVHVLGFEKVAL